MKKLICLAQCFAVFFFVIMLLVGCGGHHSAKINLNPDGIYYQEASYSLTPANGPVSLSEAYAIKKRADAETMILEANAELIRANTEQMRQGGREFNQGNSMQTPGYYQGVIINDDMRRTFYFKHPEMDLPPYQIPPGKSQFIYTKTIPKTVFGWFRSDHQSYYTIFQMKWSYNLIETQFNARIKPSR